MQENLSQLLAVQRLVGAQHARKQAASAFPVQVILAFSFRIPAPLVAEENHAVTVVQEHLCCAARVVAGLRVLERHADVTNPLADCAQLPRLPAGLDRKSTRLNSSHLGISYAVFCLKKTNARSCTMIRAARIVDAGGARVCTP